MCLFFIKNFYFICLYICVRELEDNLPKSVLTFHPVGPRIKLKLSDLTASTFPLSHRDSPKEMFMKLSYLDHFRGHDLFETIDFPWGGGVNDLYIIGLLSKDWILFPDLHHKGFLNHEICLTQRKETKNNSSW